MVTISTLTKLAKSIEQTESDAKFGSHAFVTVIFDDDRTLDIEGDLLKNLFSNIEGAKAFAKAVGKDEASLEIHEVTLDDDVWAYLEETFIIDEV